MNGAKWITWQEEQTYYRIEMEEVGDIGEEFSELSDAEAFLETCEDGVYHIVEKERMVWYEGWDMPSFDYD